MRMVRTRTTPRFKVLLTLAAVIAIASCSDSPFPTGPTPTAEETGMENFQALVAAAETAAELSVSDAVSVPSSSGIVISPRAGVAGAKRGLPLVQEKKIRKSGGRITILAQDKRTLVHFRVPRGALKKTVLIRMEVVGSGPTVEVHFGPSSLQFLRDCKLTISIPRSDLDLDELGGFLLNEDGTVIEVPFSIRSTRKRIYITIAVSHFSIYSPSDGEDESAAHDEEGGYGYGYGWP